MYKAVDFASTSNETTYDANLVDVLGFVKDTEYTDENGYNKYYLPRCGTDYYILIKPAPDSSHRNCVMYDSSGTQVFSHTIGNSSARWIIYRIDLPNNGVGIGIYQANSGTTPPLILTFIKSYDSGLNTFLYMTVGSATSSTHNVHLKYSNHSFDINSRLYQTPIYVGKIVMVPLMTAAGLAFNDTYQVFAVDNNNATSQEVVVDGRSYLLIGNYIWDSGYVKLAVPLS